MKSKTIFALTLLIILSCYPAKTVIDFTPEGSFTNGIEGPATDFEGNIYAVNFEEEGTIGRVTPEGKSSIFIKLPNGSIGNGIRFGEKYQMFIADYTNHNILEIDLRTKKLTVFAHETNANQPNDITVLRKNIVFASDPKWSDSTGQLWKITKEKGFELLKKNMGTTNGIEVNPEGTKFMSMSQFNERYGCMISLKMETYKTKNFFMLLRTSVWMECGRTKRGFYMFADMAKERLS